MTAAIRSTRGAPPESRWLVLDVQAERRSRDPVNLLARRIDDVCTTAVDIYQIAAALEAEGINDRIAREDYGRPDVFSLAADLHGRVPLRAGAAGGGDAPPARNAVTLILRGPIYLMPALFFLAVGELFDSPAALAVLLASLLLAWIWNHGAGALLHRLIGRAEMDLAASTARWSLVLGTGVLSLCAWLLAELWGAGGYAVLLAVAQAAFLISSSALLALSRDRVLVAILAPAGLLVVALGAAAASGVVIGTVAAATVLVVVVAMVRETRVEGHAWIAVPSLRELSLAGRHASFGGTWALLIGSAGLAVHPTQSTLAVVGVAGLPLVLSMGIAEWQLATLRNRARESLLVSFEPGQFSARSRQSFLIAYGIYAGSIAASTPLVLPVAQYLGLPVGRTFYLSAAFLFLGWASFAGLALVSMGGISMAGGLSAVGLVATAGLVSVARSGLMDPITAYGIGCFVLSVALALVALRRVSEAVMFR